MSWASSYGPLLLALYFVATTRWGSYLLPGPPYIGDLALAALIGERIWALARHRAPTPLIGRAVGITTGTLLAYSILRLAIGDLSVTALRDAAPYLYAVLVFFGQSPRALAPRTVEALVFAALIFHVAWYSVAEFIPSAITVGTLGDGTVLLFGGRPDIDGAFLAVLFALGLDRTILGRTPLLSAACGGWALTLVLLTQSRASFLAAIAAFGFIVVRHALLWKSGRTTDVDAGEARGSSSGSRRKVERSTSLGLVLAMLVGVPLGVTLISGTPAPLARSLNAVSLLDGSTTTATTKRPQGSRGSETDGGGRGGGSENGGGGDDGGPSNGKGQEGRPGDGKKGEKKASSQLGDTGVGTAAARTAGWKAVLEWIPDGGVSRVTAGVGFGPHYLQRSGADIAFLGPAADPSVRAVHNFGLNTWARLGLLGVALVGVIVALSLVAALRLASRTVDPPVLDLFACLLVVTIPLVAFLGVVLESPFGAIPYFWAAGYLSARMVEEGLWRSLKLPSWLAGGS